MFVKDSSGNFVNLLLVGTITANNKTVIAYSPKHANILYTGDSFQAYMTELEKELKAYGKLILIEVKPEIKCTCGKNDAPVWDHAENCPAYAPF